MAAAGGEDLAAVARQQARERHRVLLQAGAFARVVGRAVEGAQLARGRLEAPLHGQRPQPLDVPGLDHAAGPLECLVGDALAHVRPGEAVGDALVGVPEAADHALLAQQRDRLVGRGPVPDEVAEAQDRFDPRSVQRRERGLQGQHVGVDVRDQA